MSQEKERERERKQTLGKAGPKSHLLWASTLGFWLYIALLRNTRCLSNLFEDNPLFSLSREDRRLLLTPLLNTVTLFAAEADFRRGQILESRCAPTKQRREGKKTNGVQGDMDFPSDDGMKLIRN